METSLAESQPDSYFPHKVAKWLPKTKRCERHKHSKTNYEYNKIKPWKKNRLGTVSEKYFNGGGGGGGGARGRGGGLNRFYVATILALISAAI